MRKRRKNLKWPERKEPPLFWQTEFLEKVVLALVVMVSVAAAARLLIEFAQGVSF
jgi:hypothetical protein